MGSIFDKPVNIFNWPKSYSRTKDVESIHPLTEMSTRDISGGKARPERKADNLKASCKPIVYKVSGILAVSQPYEPPRLLPLKLSRS
jgi:hypothetical protein